jgi:gliding motility-associated-like protein
LVNPQPAPITGPGSVCVGQFITLSDADAGGTWTAANTNAIIDSNSGLVLGVTGGTDPISYTFTSTGCANTFTVTVNLLSPIMAQLTDVCVGSSINLSDSTAGGVWTSSNTGIATVGSVSGVVTGVSSGAVTIYYTITATGCQVDTTIIVNPLPGDIIGVTPVCAGGSTIQLSDETLGGNWSVGNTAVATIDPTGGLLTGVTAGTARVTYTLPTGCLITATVLVNPLPAPITGAGLPDLCIYSSVVLSDATPGGTWSSLNTFISLDTTTKIVTGDTVGIGYVVYTLPTGCIWTATINVRPLPVVTITHTPTGLICKGASTTLTASGAGAGPFVGINPYLWSPPNGLNTTSGASVVASPTLTTTYVVLVTTKYGCQDTGSTIVWVDSALNHLAVTGKTDICKGECSMLIVTGGQDSVYQWHPFTGLNCTNCDSTLACPTDTTTYTVIAVDYYGCRDSASITVNVHPLPVIVISPNPTIVCRRSTTTVTASGAGPGGHYTWSPGLFINCDTCAQVVLSDTANTVYEVTGTTIYGCTDSISVKVSVLDTNINTISNDTIICIGDTILLRAYSQSITSNLDVPTFHWTPAAGLSDPDFNTPWAYPTVTTLYNVHIVENVCFSKDLQVLVSVEPLPLITITPPSANVIAGTSVQLLAQAPNVIVSSFAWSPSATLSCDTCDNPIALPVSTSTTYTVTAVSNFGCIANNTVTITMFCDNSQIFIPNTFTPNGDGVNDRFYISGKGITNIVRFAVYNRWGQLLYEAHNINVNDQAAGWDGTYKGYVLEPDVFIYEVDAICEFGAPFSYKGDVSIVR